MNKKKTFTFRKINDYGRNGPKFYKSQPRIYKRQFEKCCAHIETAVNGPKTAFARIEFYSTFFTNTKIGFYLYRHFEGYNCYKQAVKWCNFLFNNPPYGSAYIKNEKVRPDNKD